VIAAANNPNTTLEQRAAAEQQLSNAMVNLRATAEAYPDLKANQNFMDLQQKLAGLEDKIAYGRQFYNDVVLNITTRSCRCRRITPGFAHFVIRASRI
jgi:LemA protein